MKETEILSFEIISKELSRLRNKDMRTNFFLSEEKWNFLKEEHEAVIYTSDHGFYFLIRLDGFYKYFFITNEKDDLQKNLVLIQKKFENDIVVCEIVGNEDYLADIQTQFTKAGEFNEYTRLIRMSRMRSGNKIFEFSPPVHLLSMDRISELQSLFLKYFNKFAEQIPTWNELEKMVQAGNVYYYSDNTDIQGFIIFERSGIISHLRYWFVHPEYRGKKIGSQLMNLFFTKFEEVRREIFWVIDTNENAIKRYKHFGYLEEKIYNIVLINKKLEYEEQNN